MLTQMLFFASVLTFILGEVGFLLLTDLREAGEMSRQTYIFLLLLNTVLTGCALGLSVVFGHAFPRTICP